MGQNYAVIVEETTRGIDPASGYLFLPLTSNLFPSYTPGDEARTEFRAQDAALGSSPDAIVRREDQVTHTLECPFYAGAETGLLFKHLLGFAGTRATVETTAKKGVLYPLAQPFGAGRELESKAVGIYVVYDKEGVSRMRYYGGFRINSCNLTGEGTDDLKLAFEMKAPGDFIGAEVANTFTPASTDFPSDPYVTSDLLCYIGSGISRTGTAPDYTDIDPGTMVGFCPDSVNMTITNGLDDKVILCGTQGPNKTFRSAQFAIELGFPIDLADPDTGFSPFDEWATKFDGPHTNSVLLVADNGILAGDTSETFRASFDLGTLLANHDTPDVSPEGTQSTIQLNYTSLVDETTTKPLIMETVDQAAAY